MTFSERLKSLRLEQSLTQKQMAKKFGVSERNWQNYESGRNYPKLETVMFLADFFDVSIDYLVGRSDKR